MSAGSSTGTQYASPAARIEWGGKIEQANILPRLEYETVKHDLRPCGLLFGIDPARLDEMTSRYAKEGLVLRPIAKMAAAGEGFCHFLTPPKEDDTYRLKCVISRSNRNADRFGAAESENDDLWIGQMLGYPRCCARFFESMWRQGYFDPIWQSAENTAEGVVRSRDVCHDSHGKPVEQNIVLAPGPEGCKISSCLRYIGVRITSHFACSANCRASIEIADQRIDLARRLAMTGVEAALEILRLPCRWECQNGVAVVSTPAFSFDVRSMPYSVKHVVQQEGCRILKTY
ncbi:MAG: hypothetical protein WA738_15365 [Candidatus Angelobacter sp.]